MRNNGAAEVCVKHRSLAHRAARNAPALNKQTKSLPPDVRNRQCFNLGVNDLETSTCIQSRFQVGPRTRMLSEELIVSEALLVDSLSIKVGKTRIGALEGPSP
jgi:hypothetical protein